MHKYKFRHLLLTASAASILSGCTGGTAASSTTTPANITINKIELVNDSTAGSFSMYIHFENKTLINNWKFGFYMPFTFSNISPWNPNLAMEICLENSSQAYTNCEPIDYNQNSAGWTTMLSVSTSSRFYELQPNIHYVIIAHNNSMGNPRNYSSFPQNFFVMVNNQITNIPTTANQYVVSNYNQSEITAQIDAHINSNWESSLSTTPDINIVPYPVHYSPLEGSYTIADGITIHNTLSTTNSISDFYQATLKSDININSQTDTHSGITGIIIKPLEDTAEIDNNSEGYTIDVTNNSITISAINDTGAFYALQTLRQLWNHSTTINGMNLIDYPRFKYRGMTLDSARHFQSVTEIQNLLDIMAFHKLNTLHWHLTDDEGYRISSERYPTLTSIGGYRGFNYPIIPQLIKQANLDVISGTDTNAYATATSVYSGYYTNSDFLALIEYANKRGITIIPEIDLPGHARALRFSLPNAYNDPNDLSVYASVQGFDDNVIPVCTYNSNISVGPEFTATTNNIINDIAELFNHQTTLYAINNEVSLGGDEVSSNAWTNDSSCQNEWMTMTALAKSQYFFQIFSQSNSDLMISGWQQLVQNDDTTIGTNAVSPQSTGHIWVWNSSTPGVPQAQSLANAGYPVVLNFSDQVYFDLTYTPNQTELGQYWATSYSDTQAALSIATSATSTLDGTADPAKVEGVEGNLWSENLVTQQDLLYMALPKMAGVSEAGWSPTVTTNQNGKVDWQSLAYRLGCGQYGFLAQIYKLYGAEYRGYPNGIVLEVPDFVCPNK